MLSHLSVPVIIVHHNHNFTENYTKECNFHNLTSESNDFDLHSSSGPPVVLLQSVLCVGVVLFGSGTGWNTNGNLPYVPFVGLVVTLGDLLGITIRFI